VTELGALLETGPHRDVIEATLAPGTFSRRALRRYLQKAWRAHNAGEIARVRSAAREELIELPYSEVALGDVTYRVHGIAHPQPHLGIRWAPGVKETLTGFVGAFDGPHEGYVLEYGFAEALGLPSEHEAGRGRDIFDAVGGRTASRFVLKRILLLPMYPLTPFLVRFSREAAMKELWASLRDLRRLPSGRRLFALTQLPEPVASEVAGPTDAKFVWAMSEGMARTMRERAEKNSWRIVHCVCGFGHEAQIVLALSGDAPIFASRSRRF